ncbi:MAG: autotransporter-associated beta strand repeat-containing protein [Thermoguttaceae bacterium]|nr:autotransporter-associated beta strand repeat-containing protein [Thermoguttaceae bacterium]
MLTRHIAFSGQNRISNRVWIFAAFFAAALAFDLAVQQTAAADETMTTFFSDNYNVNGNKKGTAIGGPSDNDKPERFSGGVLGALGYSFSGASTDMLQVGNGYNNSALFQATNKNSGYTTSITSPNYDFGNNLGALNAVDLGGKTYEISFKVNPVTDDAATSGNWTAVTFGLTSDKQLSSVNTGNGVGILFRRNGGIQIFDGTNGNSSTSFANVFSPLSGVNDWANVRIVYTVPDFNGTSPVDVSLYVNDNLVSTFKTAKGFTSNYTGFVSYSNGSSYSRSLIDDFTIKSNTSVNFEVDRIVDTSRTWTINGVDKKDVVFLNQKDGSSSAAHSGTIALGADAQFIIGAGLNLDQSGAISGENSITKIGDGTLTISGANDEFTGTTNVNAGTLRFAGNGSLNNSVIRLNGGNLELGFDSNQTFSKEIQGTGNLVKTGDGIVTLGTSSYFVGDTTVSGGTLVLTNGVTLDSNDIYVTTGGTLKVGNEFISNNVILNGGALTVGDASNTQTIQVGSVTVNGGTINMDFNSSSTYEYSVDADWLKVGSASFDSGYINLSFNNNDESTWWNYIKEDGGFYIISGSIGDFNNMNVRVDGMPSSSWALEADSQKVYLMAVGSAPSGESSWWLPNSDLSEPNWTIDGETKQGIRFNAGSTTATYSNPVILSANGTVDIAAGYNLTLSGKVSGSGKIEKVGEGTLTLNATNDQFTGATTVSEGTLALDAQNAISNSSSVKNNAAITMGAAQSLNNLSGNGTIDNGGNALTVVSNAETEFSGSISGAGSFTKNGSEKLTLSGNNTYSGGTNIGGGVLSLASADSLGSGAIAFTGTSTLQVGSDLTLADGMSLQSGATGTINTNGRDVTVSGVISGEGNLTKTGIGTLTLSNAANSFSGNIIVAQGTLKSGAVWSNPNCSMGVISKEGSRSITVMPGAELYLSTNDSFGGCDGYTYTANDIKLIVNGGTVRGENNNSLYGATFQNGAVLYGVSNQGTWRSFWLKGPTYISFAGDGTTPEAPVTFSGTSTGIIFVPDNAVIDVQDLTLNSDPDLIVNVALGNKASSAISTNSLTKTGPGTMELKVAGSSFTGDFIINEGTVLAKGGWSSSNGTSPIGKLQSRTVYVNNGAELVFFNQDAFTNAHTDTSINFVLDGGRISNSGTIYEYFTNITLKNGAEVYASDGNVPWKAYKFKNVNVKRNDDNTPAAPVTFSADMSKPNAVFCFGGNTASLNDGTSLATLYVEDITSVNPSLADNQPDFIISAVIADPCVDTSSQATKPGAIKKTGSGMLKLTANNTYTGATTVSAGTLLLASSGKLASDVTVEAGGTFIDGANSITSDVTLTGGAFTIGETSATSRITIGDFALTSGTVNFDFNNAATANDFDTLTTGAATLTSGVINVTFNNGDETSWWNNAADNGYVLLTSSALTADLDNLAVYINSSETTNWYLTTEGNTLVLNKTGSVISQPYYYADSAEDMSAAKWTIDGTDKLGAKLVSGENASVTYSNPVEMNAKGSVQVAADYNLTLAGNITGSGDLEKTDAGTLTIASTNDGFTGATKVSGGTLALTAQNAISNSASVENNSLITMSADQKLNNLTGFGSIDNGGAELTLNNSAATEYSGVVSGAGALVKTGAETLTLSAAQTYTGNTTVSGGTLKLTGDGTLASTTINIGDGGRLLYDNMVPRQVADTTINIGEGGTVEFNMTSTGRSVETSLSSGVGITFTGDGTWVKSGTGDLHCESGNESPVTFALSSKAKMIIENGSFTNGGWTQQDWTNNYSEIIIKGTGVLDLWNGNKMQVGGLTGEAGSKMLAGYSGSQGITIGAGTTSDQTFTYNGVMDFANASTVTKIGDSTQIINGDIKNATIQANGGTLVLGAPNETMYVKPTSSITTNGGNIRVDGNVVLNDGSAYVLCSGDWTGNGSLTINNGGYMRVNDLNFTNGITLDNGFILNNDNDAVLRADVTVTNDNDVSKVQAGWSKMLTLTGALKGDASLTVGNDSGIVRFMGDASQYNGSIIVVGNMRVGTENIGTAENPADGTAFIGSNDIILNGATATIGILQNSNNYITIPNNLNVVGETGLKAGWEKDMTFTGNITGSGKIKAKSDSGWVIMGTQSPDNSFSGVVQTDWASTSSMGKMRLAAQQPFGSNAGAGYIYGQLDMNGYSQIFKGLYSNVDGSTQKGAIFNNTESLSTLTLDITGYDDTYQGKINGNIELIINSNGEGKQTFANNGSSFTGNVVINGGTVATTKSRTGTTSALGATTTPGGRTITVNAGAELALGASDTFGGCDSTNVYDDNSVRLIVNGGKISGTNNNSLYNATFQNGAELYGNNNQDTWRSFWLKGTTNVSFAGDGSTPESPVNFNGADGVVFIPDNATFNVDDITKSSAADLVVNVTLGNKSTSLITTDSVTKTGAGTMRLTAPNEYTGPTTVSGGALTLASTGSLVSDVTVAAGASFIDAAPTITSNVTLNGGSLVIGDTTASTQIAIGNLVVDNGSIFFDFNDSAGAADYDRLTVNAATFTTGTISVAFNNGDQTDWWNNNTDNGYVLINTTSLNANLDNIQLLVNSAATDAWYLDTVGTSIVLKNQNVVPPVTDLFYRANTPEAIAEDKWTIDGTNKQGVKFTEGDQNAVTYNGEVEMNANGSVEVAENKNLTLAGVVSGEGNVEKIGDGTLTLSGNNTYTGKTTVTEGTLALTGDAVKANSSIDIANDSTLVYNVDANEEPKQLTFSDTITVSGEGNVIKTGAGKLKIKADGDQFSSENFTVKAGELDFKGQYNGDLIVKNGATLSPGNSVGDLTVYGNVIIETGATGLFEFSSYNEDPAQQQFDTLAIDGAGAFVIDENSIIKLYFENNDADLWATEGAEYQLVSDADFNVNVMPTLGNYQGWFDLIGKGDGLYLVGLGAPESTGVPEPSTWALLLLGAMGLLYMRKRK